MIKPNSNSTWILGKTNPHDLQTLKAELKLRLRLEDEVAADGVELKREGKNLVGCCPFHSEHTGSFKIHVGGQFFKCFGCGKGGDVLDYFAFKMSKATTGADFVDVIKHGCARAGIDFAAPVTISRPAAQQQPKPPKSVIIYPTFEKLNEAVAYFAGSKNGKIAGQYKYIDPLTKTADLFIFRIEFTGGKKSFIQCTPTTGGYAMQGIKDRKNPIYNRAQIAGANAVVLVEGEKCVQMLHKYGISATTSPGGSKNGKAADWAPLAGKLVTIWPDDDECGKNYARDVAAELQQLDPPAMVSIIDVDLLTLGQGGDVCDFVAQIAELPPVEIAAALVDVIDGARTAGPVGELEHELNEAIAGRRRNIPFCWPLLSQATKALIPGSVFLLCGGPGGTKSLSLLQNLREWQQNGVPAVALMCEDGAAYHMRRALAQICSNGRLTHDDFCHANPDAAAAAMQSAKPTLHALSAYIEAPASEDDLTPESVLAWIEAKAEAGKRIICIDPITAMTKGQFGFNDDQRLMMKAKRIIEKHRASLVLITHPRKAPAMQKSQPPTISDISGGVAYERFAHSIVFLRAHDTQHVLFKTSLGKANGEANRTMYIWKARNSGGNGMRIAYWFDANTLTLKELGEIESED